MAEETKDPQLPKVPQQVQGSNNQETQTQAPEDLSALSDAISDSVSSMGNQMSTDVSSLTGAISSVAQDTQSVVSDATTSIAESATEQNNKIVSALDEYRNDFAKETEESTSILKKEIQKDRDKEDKRFEKQTSDYRGTTEKMAVGLKNSMVTVVGGVGDAFTTAFDDSPIAKGISDMAGNLFNTFKENIKKRRQAAHDTAAKKKKDIIEAKRAAEDKAIQQDHEKTLKEIESISQEELEAQKEATEEIATGLGTHSPPYLETIAEKLDNVDETLGESSDDQIEVFDNIEKNLEGLEPSEAGAEGEPGAVEGTDEFLGSTEEHLSNISSILEEMLGRTPTDAEKEEARLDAASAGGGDDGGDDGDGKKEGMIGGIIGGIGRGIGSLGKGIGKLGKGIGGAIKGVLTGIAHGLLAFANPLVLVGAIAMGLAIGAILITLGAVSKILKAMNVDFTPLRSLFESFTPILEALGTAFATIVTPFTDLIKVVLVALIDKLDMIQPLILGLASAFNEILKTLEPIVTAVINFLTVAAPYITTIIDSMFKFGTVLLNTISTVLTTIKDLILGTIEGVVGGIERFAALDGSNLMSVGVGMLSISAGLAAFGVGGALAGIGGAIGAFFGGDPVEKFKRFGEIAEPLEKAGIGAFALGQGIKALASVNLNKLGKQIGPFVDAIKDPLQELSEIEFSTAQANVITELLATLSAEGKDALATAKSQAGAVVTQQINNNMAQSTTAPVFPRTKTIDSPPEMWASRADF